MANSKHAEGSKKQTKYMEVYKTLSNQRSEALLKLQKSYKIKVNGDLVPEMLDTFSKMKDAYDISDGFIAKVKKAGFKRPTPVQMQAIPILFEKRDAIVLAETGSGKSLAFIAPLIHIHKKGAGLKSVILVPTRELAIQLYKEFLMFNDQSGA